MYTKERRVKLEKGQQNKLIQDLTDKYGSLKSISEKWNMSYSMIKKYNQGIFLLPENIFNKIISELDINLEGLNVSYLDYNWGMKIGSRNGMKALETKYPEKINLWRKQALIKSHKNRLKKIKFPEFNESLAEFIGIYLGDGTLTEYCLRISGDKRYDLNYFNHVNKIAFDNFRIMGKIYADKITNQLSLAFFSKELSSFFTKELGIKVGDKIRNKSLIPLFIMENQSLSIACLRGLVDTDGSISRRGRNGSQFTITFNNHNIPLLLQVKEISDNSDIFTFFSEKDKCIGTNKADKIKEYFSKIGSSNLRHIVRYIERFKNNNTIYQSQVSDYYQKPFYRDILLPFKTAS